MISEYLVCPQGKTTLNKPVQYQVLGEVTKAGGSFIAMGDSDSVPCGICGFRCRKRRSSRANSTPQPLGTEAKS